MAGYQGTLSEDPFSNKDRKHDALAGADFGPGGMVSDDEEKDNALREKILKTLEDHVEVDASEVHVDVMNGFVSLTGTVKNAEDKAMVEGLVESINHVKDVASMLEIEKTSDLAQSLSGQDDFIIQGPS